MQQKLVLRNIFYLSTEPSLFVHEELLKEMIRKRNDCFVQSSEYSLVKCLTDKWNKTANDFIEKQRVNPFSDRYSGKFAIPTKY